MGLVAATEIDLEEDLFDGRIALDSLDCLNVLMELEQTFALELGVVDITRDDFRTVKQLAALVRSCQTSSIAQEASV